MKFCCFTPVPWPDLASRPDSWPFPNAGFDASRCADLYEDAAEQLVLAERVGFDWVGVGEDHMTAYGLTPNPLLLLSIVAARTRRVRLVTMGCPVPLLNPIRLAEELAMVDVLSRGRVIAGLIRGVPQNYAAYNVDPNESRARFDEGIELMLRAWTSTEPFAWESEHYRFPKVSLWPRPHTSPHPPLLFSANSVESAQRAAQRRAIIAAIHLYNRDALERISGAIEAYQAAAAKDGWQPSPEMFVVGLHACIGTSDAEAQDRLAPALDYQYNTLSGTYNAEKRKIAATTGYGLSPTEERPPTFEERLDRGLILCGTPETVAGQIEHLRDRLGVGVISIQAQIGNMEAQTAAETIQRFGDQILPRFAGESQRAGASQ